MQPYSPIPEGYSYPATAAWFLAGGVVTAAFSGSLAVLAVNATFAEVIAIGMIVPCFTWVVQGFASTLLLPSAPRQIYHGDLGRICFWGSVALLPGALVNLVLPNPPLWLSGANILASVALMAYDLFRRCAAHRLPWGWPASWVGTICVNMTLFYLASRHWWAVGE